MEGSSTSTGAFLKIASLARTLCQMRGSGTLFTLQPVATPRVSSLADLRTTSESASASTHHNDNPQGLMLPRTVFYTLNAAGKPLLFLRQDSPARTNLQHNPAASLMVHHPPVPCHSRPVPSEVFLPRVNMVGTLRELQGTEESVAYTNLLERHANLAGFFRQTPCVFCELQVESVHYTPGRGESHTLMPADFQKGSPDYLSLSCGDLLFSVNEEHAKELRSLCAAALMDSGEDPANVRQGYGACGRFSHSLRPPPLNRSLYPALLLRPPFPAVCVGGFLEWTGWASIYWPPLSQTAPRSTLQSGSLSLSWERLWA